MAWNPRFAWMLICIAGLCAGCWGCQPEKQSDNSGKDKTTSERPQPKIQEKKERETASKPTDSGNSNTDRVENPAKSLEDKSLTETAGKSQDENPPPIPAPKPVHVVKIEKKVKPPLPPPATIPKVSLTEKLRATCLVKVGDELPDVDLSALEGNRVSLKSFYGDALTVVFIWNAGTTSYAQQSIVGALGDMQKDILEPYSAKELRVVGINVGDEAENAKKILERGDVKFPVLLDPKGGYFQNLATETLPRVFLLDGAGKILWFDIGYTRATRRELLTGIKAVLEGKK
jgi:peroxiredoxin